jgi:hypothetical protein
MFLERGASEIFFRSFSPSMQYDSKMLFVFSFLLCPPVCERVSSLSCFYVLIGQLNVICVIISLSSA